MSESTPADKAVVPFQLSSQNDMQSVHVSGLRTTQAASKKTALSGALRLLRP